MNIVYGIVMGAIGASFASAGTWWMVIFLAFLFAGFSTQIIADAIRYK